MSETPVAVVAQWQDAANSGDVEQLLALSDAEVELIGPRGRDRGHQALREWLDRAGLRVQALRSFSKGNAVVVEQIGEWRTASEEPRGEQTVASAFVVDAGKITRVARFDRLDEALEAAGIAESDEVRIEP